MSPLTINGVAINRRIKVIAKSVPFVLIVTFIWLYLKLNNYESERLSNNLEQTNKEVFNDVFLPNKSVDHSISLSLNQIKELIANNNKEEKVSHLAKYGPLKDDDIVMVIQVHNRGQYLAALIKSLERTKGIENVLLVFSHDLFDTTINDIVKSIKFCKVIQIFYPNSLQLHPNSFPGESPNDCPRNMNKEEALKKKCINAESPDSYGHYREAKYTQTKHHWWWKINHVMDVLHITRNFSGYFLFLEEDHYLSPDSLYVLRQMMEFRKKNCEKCDFLTLGIYVKSLNFAKNGNKIELTKWISSKHNMGFALDRGVWNRIKSCAEKFCTYDDYNWDWSLQHISQKCLSFPLLTIVVSTPRVFHIGECGVHHKGKDCNSYDIVHRVESIIRESSKYLFPSQLILQNGSKRTIKPPKGNGGWNDKRDHQLCLEHVNQIKNNVKLAL